MLRIATPGRPGPPSSPARFVQSPVSYPFAQAPAPYIQRQPQTFRGGPYLNQVPQGGFLSQRGYLQRGQFPSQPNLVQYAQPKLTNNQPQQLQQKSQQPARPQTQQPPVQRSAAPQQQQQKQTPQPFNPKEMVTQLEKENAELKSKLKDYQDELEKLKDKESKLEELFNKLSKEKNQEKHESQDKNQEE